MSSPPLITVLLFVTALLFTCTLFFDKLIKFFIAYRNGAFSTSSKPSKEVKRITQSKKPSSPVAKTKAQPIANPSNSIDDPNGLMGRSRNNPQRSLPTPPPDETSPSSKPNKPTYYAQKKDPDYPWENGQNADESHQLADQPNLYEGAGYKEEKDEIVEDDVEDITEYNEDDANMEDDLSDDELLDSEDDGPEDGTHENDAPALAASTFSQLGAKVTDESTDWGDKEDEQLEIAPGGFEEYDLDELNASDENQPEGVRADVYLNRIDIVRTSIYDIGRVARRKERKQTTALLCANLVSLINHYKMNSDKNVGNLIRQEVSLINPSSDTFEDRLAFYAKLQKGILVGEFEEDNDQGDY